MYRIITTITLPNNISQPASYIYGSNIIGDDGTIENQIFELFKQAGMYEDAVKFDDLLVQIGNNMLFQTPAIWCPQTNSVVRYAWNDQDLYTSAFNEFNQNHLEQLAELAKLGCTPIELEVTESNVDVYQLLKLYTIDCNADEFLSAIPSYVLENSTILAEYYTKEISRNLEQKKN